MSPFISAKQKLKRAGHIHDELRAAIASFNERRPFVLVGEEDDCSGHVIFRVEVREDIPLELATIIGDFVHNVRSALDVLMVALISGSDGTNPATRRSIQFPITKSRAAVAAALKAMKWLPDNVRSQIEQIEPFPSGNGRRLCDLHELSIIDKHRLILPVGSALSEEFYGSVLAHVGTGSQRHMMAVGHIPKERRVFRHRDVIATLTRDSPTSEYVAKTNFGLVFGSDTPVAGQSILTTLHSYGTEVAKIVDEFEARRERDGHV